MINIISESVRYFKTLLLGSVFIFITGSIYGQVNIVKVGSLTVEGKADLLGLDLQHPRLSWKLYAETRNIKQVAYRIIVSSTFGKLASDNGDIWDSQKVMSDTSLNISAHGKLLQSNQMYYWKVKVWTNKGVTDWSKPSKWMMGMLNQSEWKADWIGMKAFNANDHPNSTFTRLAARYLRKNVVINKNILKATAFISGLGLYELHINGEKIGADVLAPGVSEYNKKVFYNTLDVTNSMKKGANGIGVILGNGRFFNMREYNGKPDPLTGIPQANYGFPRLLLQISVQYEDGSSSLIVSDKSWKITDQGPILANNEYDGEEFDANKKLKDWSQAWYNDNQWKPVDIMTSPAERIQSQLNENICIKEVLRPKSVHKTSRGTYILDMGQNMVGWMSVKVKGSHGDTLTMRFAERLKSSDSLYMDNLRKAKATDKYIFQGIGLEQWEPSFTYHGFRFVEISGLKYMPTINDFAGKVIYDDVATTGTFITSNPTINAIYNSSYWTIRGNYRGMPTDCPQRDERVAWLGDRVMSSYGESFIFDNSRLYAKWLNDINDAQKENGSLPDIAPSLWTRYQDNVTYPSAFIIIPEMLRKQFGDNESFRIQYPAMKKWILYMWNTYNENNLILKDNYGDWCVPPESLDLIWTKDTTRITNGGLLASAYYYYCLTLMQQYASALGYESDVNVFNQISERVYTAFNNKFYHEKSKSYANNTVTANLLPLTFGLAPEKDRHDIFKNILSRLKEFDNHVNSGIIGGMWLMRGLSDNGRPDLAYKLATNTTYPSWGYMMKQGSTTIWELWNGDAANPMMNSGNHQMLLGDLLIWYYEYLAGIKTDTKDVAFKKIIMNPYFPAELRFVNASLETEYGMVKSSWERTDKSIKWKIIIPPNSAAEVHFPEGNAGKIKESGKSINAIFDIKSDFAEKGKTVVLLGSGSYNFEINN